MSAVLVILSTHFAQCVIGKTTVLYISVVRRAIRLLLLLLLKLQTNFWYDM